MLKAGIFLDVANLTLNGGRGLRYDVVRQLVAAQQTTVLRANAYFSINQHREQADPDFRQRAMEYRNAVRRANYRLQLKPVRRYRDDAGELVTKANTDLDIGVDAMTQADNLDYVLLGTGDGDFVRLVQALQSRGKRVDLLSFGNTSTELRQSVDYHFSGFLVPGLTGRNGEGRERTRGIMHGVNEEKGYGFLTVRTGLEIDAVRTDVFCHITDMREPMDNERFARLKTEETILEFDLEEQDDGRVKAVNTVIFDWEQAQADRRAPANGDRQPEDTEAEDEQWEEEAEEESEV